MAAKLSARLGEGVVNGLLTARLGLAAIEVTRPLPFAALPAPALRDVASGLISSKDRQGRGRLILSPRASPPSSPPRVRSVSLAEVPSPATTPA